MNGVENILENMTQHGSSNYILNQLTVKAIYSLNASHEHSGINLLTNINTSIVDFSSFI